MVLISNKQRFYTKTKINHDEMAGEMGRTNATMSVSPILMTTFWPFFKQLLEDLFLCSPLLVDSLSLGCQPVNFRYRLLCHVVLYGLQRYHKSYWVFFLPITYSVCLYSSNYSGSLLKDLSEVTSFKWKESTVQHHNNPL